MVMEMKVTTAHPMDAWKCIHETDQPVYMQINFFLKGVDYANTLKLFTQSPVPEWWKWLQQCLVAPYRLLLWNLGKQGCPLVDIQNPVAQSWHVVGVFWMNVKMAKAGSGTTECLLVIIIIFSFFLFFVFAIAFPYQSKDYFCSD